MANLQDIKDRLEQERYQKMRESDKRIEAMKNETKSEIPRISMKVLRSNIYHVGVCLDRTNYGTAKQVLKEALEDLDKLMYDYVKEEE